MDNRKLWRIGLLLVLMMLIVAGCSGKYKNSYGYWSGTDNSGYVTYDIKITKDNIIMLENDMPTKYKYKKERIGVRNAMVISGKELARNIEGMDKSTNSFATLALIDDDKKNPYIYITVNMEGNLSEASLYPIDKEESPLSQAEGSKSSWFMLIIPIALFLYLYTYRKK